MRNSLHKKVLITFLTLLCVGFSQQMLSQVSGDFKSKASGPWSSNATWQRFNGTTWENVASGVVPGQNNSVYLQKGHTITVDANYSVKDLHLNAEATARIHLLDNTLSVYGKMRAFIGAVDELPGTSTATLPAFAPWISSWTGGKIKIVGDSRVVFAAGEWGSGNTSNEQPTGFELDVDLNPLQVATFQTDVKARAFTVSAGTLKMAGNHRLIPDQGFSAGSVTIKDGAIMESDASGTGATAVMGRTSAMDSLVIEFGGHLKLTGAEPTMSMASITNSGIVEYARAGNQTMLVPTGGGADLSYQDLYFSGGGIKSMTKALVVARKLAIASGTTLNNAGFNITYSSPDTSIIEGGVISGSGELYVTSGALQFNVPSANNTNQTYTGDTHITSGEIRISGLSGISSAEFSSASQVVTFSAASPAVGTYNLFPGAVSISSESFTHNADNSRKVTFDYTTGTLTVAEATISTVIESFYPFCPGNQFFAGFSTDVAVFGNYVVQLSDASGSFDSATEIGQGTSSPITATIPADAVAGSGYRYRVINTDTGIIGSDNGHDFTINAYMTLGLASAEPACIGSPVFVNLTGLRPDISGTVHFNLGVGGTTNVAFESDSDGNATVELGTAIEIFNGLTASITDIIDSATECSINFDLGQKTFTMTINPALTVSYPAGPYVFIEGTAVSPISYTAVTGNDVAFSAILPAGLTIDSATGIISGTPTTPTLSNTYTVTATNDCGSVTANLTMTVNALPFTGGPCALVNEDFTSAPQLANTDVNGAWYPDRYRPAGFVADGGKLIVTISGADGAQLRPLSHSLAHNNTQGRKINQCSTCVSVAKADLFIPADWETKKRRADLWTTAIDASNTSYWPIIGFRNMTGSNPTMSVWSPSGWIDLGAPELYDVAYTLEIRLVGTDIQYLINNNIVRTVAFGNLLYFKEVMLQGYNFNDNTLGASYDSTSDNTYNIIWDNVSTGSTSGNIVANTTNGASFCSITSAINDAFTAAGHELEVGAGTYNEQVIVNKSIAIRGNDVAQPTIDFTGAVTGKPALMDVTADGVTVENIHFNVDQTTLRSAIIASFSTLDNITINDNVIDAYGTLGGSYGDRNAVSINYGGTTNYRAASGGVNNILFNGNTINGANKFRSGISIDEGTLSANGNTIASINHDIALRFSSSGNSVIQNNFFNGGGIEIAEQNGGAASISVLGNTFTGVGAPAAALLRIRNNQSNILHTVSGNTFNDFDWAVSLENMKNVTLDGNSFTGANAASRAVVVNTKSISGNSSSIVQTENSGTFINNNFNGPGIGLTFQNHDSDNATFGAYVVGTAGNENSFAATLQEFIRMDSQTGPSTSATFPAYPGNISSTTMACWNHNIDIQHNNFDIGTMKSPFDMDNDDRVLLEDKLYNKPDNACTGVLIYYEPVINETQGKKYITINDAIADANDNDVITVRDGIYEEDVVVNKPLTINGPNAGIDPNTGSRVAEAIVVPATKSAGGITLKVRASNVTIDGITFDGDNPAITSGWIGTNGADIDGGMAVGVDAANINDVIVRNNIITNYAYQGVYFYGSHVNEANTSKTGNVVANNLIKNMGHYNTGNGYDNWGGGVLLYNSHYTKISNNVMRNVRIGIQTGNFQKAHVGDAQFMVFDGNDIQTRYVGIFYNLQRFSPFTISNNNITAIDNSVEAAVLTRTWKGMLFGSLGGASMGMSNISNNTVDGSAAVSFAGRREGMNVWNVQPISPVNITGGNISGVETGVNVNNYEGYASNAAENTAAVVDGVNINAILRGVYIHDNPLNTNSKGAFAEVKNTTIAAPAGIVIDGADTGGNIHNNTVNATTMGIGVSSSVVSAVNALNIADNNVTLADQLASGTPTVGVILGNVSGSAAATLAGNDISDAFYGYSIYDVNTNPATSITGGEITGVMQGLAIVNVNPVNPSVMAPSTVNVEGITMDEFAGAHPSMSAINFHAGIYVYTAGTNAADKVTATIDNVSVTATGKISQDSAGMSFADFSTGAGTRQQITVANSNITGNFNRGINARGSNAMIEIANSDVVDNGFDSFGGSNHGYGIIGRVGAVLNIHGNHIANPATFTNTVTGIGSDNANITAYENKIWNHGGLSKYISASIGSPEVIATCNAFGVNCVEIGSMMEGSVSFEPFILDQTDSDIAARGFQPAGTCDGQIATFAGITATSLDLCHGTPQFVHLSGLKNGNTRINYLHAGNAEYVDVVVTDGTASFEADYEPGTHDVTITSLSIGGCDTPITSDNIVTFNVKPNPELSSVSVSEASVCEGSGVSFTAAGLIAGPNAFIFKIDGTPYSALANVTDGTFVFDIQPYPVGNHTFELVSSTVNGCTTTFTSNNTASFTVNPLPTIGTLSAATQCEGNPTTVVVTGLVPGASGVAVYQYNDHTPTNLSFAADANGEFSFPTNTLTMDDHGAVVSILSITLDSNPTCTVNFTGKSVTFEVIKNADAGTDGSFEICAGATITPQMLFNALGGTPDTNGTWSNVGLVYTYTVNATSPCVATDTAIVTVIENALPAPVITGNLVLTCANPTSVLDAGSYDSYLWSTGATTQTITTAANASGTYSVTVTDANGCSSTASVSVVYYPVTNETNNTHHATIAAAITAATANDVINVCKGTYENASIDMSSKALTVKGPNFGINGKATRNAEAYLINPIFKMAGSHANTLDGFYVKRTDNVNVNINLSGTGLKNVKNNIFERSAATGGALGLGIEISGSAGAKNIIGNYFWSTTTTTSGSNHKTWNSGIYLNGGGTGMVTIQDNYFYRNRTAINIDNMSLNHAAVGNTFDTNGTHVALGGGTGGSFVWGDNNFISMNGMFNLSNVAESFRLDISAGRQSNVYFSDLTDAQLLQVEGRMGGHKENTSGKRGKIIYRANNQYVRSGDKIENAIKYADPGDIINLGGASYAQKLDINKSDITIQGITNNRSGHVLNGSSGGALANSNAITIQNGMKNVKIKNLTIQGFNRTTGTLADIYALGGNDGLTIDNVALNSAREAHGIYINGGSAIDGVTITNSNIQGKTGQVRGIVIWNGRKTNINISNNTVSNVSFCGIELQDGTASAVTVSGNTVSIAATGDSGIGLTGLDDAEGPNTISNNTVTGGGRFGIELKNVNGAAVTGNTVTMSAYNAAELRDRAGIAVIRRAFLAGNSNGANVPNNVTLTGNTVSGYRQVSNSDGFGIVVEGTNHTVSNNIFNNNDIAFQQQAGNMPYTGTGGDDGDQSDKVDNYFGRGNAPTICSVDVSDNTYDGNGTDERIVTGGGTGTIVTTVTPTVDLPVDLVHCSGELSGTSFTGNTLPGVVYNWTNDNTETGLAASGSGNISFTAANLTADVQVSTITVTPVANGCEGTPQVFTITVNPDIPASVQITTPEEENCDGTSVTFYATPTNGGSAPTYQWMINGNQVADATDSTFTTSALADGDVVTVEMTSNLTPCLVESPAVSNGIQMTVIAKTVPTFAAVPSICQGDFLAALPTTSINGYTGIWSPAINNLETTTYTFTPDAGQCAATTTLTITVSPLATPSFTQVAAICAGDVLSPLPLADLNGVTGTWSPAPNNLATTTYVFTPDADQCATPALMTITVNPILTPVFEQVTPTCQLDPVAELPTTSLNGITGTWSPAINNITTTTYTFTPNDEFCAVSTTMTIEILPVIIPVFTQVASIYAGDILNPLPTTSNNGIEGTWSPALNNMETTYYAFTPFEGQCASTAIMMIEIIPNSTLIATGDFRTRQSGPWSLPQTWERFNGNVWEAAGVGSNITGLIPTAANSVYVQTGHTVTLTANAACKDLNLNAAFGLRLGLDAFTLNVNGKLRAYNGALNDLPGNATTTLPAYAGWISSTTGKLSIVGDSRDLTVAGEWGTTNAGTASPAGFNVELNLNAGQTVTANTGLRARNFNLVSGTLKVAGNNRISPDSGDSTPGNVTIQNGAVLESDASGAGDQIVIGRSASTLGGTLTINAGGMLRLTGASPIIGMASIVNNGTVAYTAAGNQNFVAPINSGAFMTSYNNLVMSGGGTKSVNYNVWIGGNITLDAATVLNNDGHIFINSASDNSIAGVITGTGSLNKMGDGILTLSAANGNNTAHSYSATSVTGGSLVITGLNEITSMNITASSQSVTFDSASPSNGTYQVVPGALSVGVENFSASATPTKLVTFDYASGLLTVADATITTSVTDLNYCAGDAAVVEFTSDVDLDGTYTAMLSDASGDFANAIAIGSSDSSPINATIPHGLAAGDDYRIRVVSSNGIVGSDNGADIVVTVAEVPTFIQVVPQCTGAAIADLPTTSEEGITGTWSPAINNAETTTYTFTPDPGQCAAPTTMTIEVGVCESIVNLKLFVQGYYIGGGEMNPVKLMQKEQQGEIVEDGDEFQVEDLTIELRDASTKALVASTQATLFTDGTLSSVFPTAPSGMFYIVVKGSNLVQTWSAQPQAVGYIPLDYDFSAAEAQAYTDGSQPSVIEMEPGVWAMYSGDVNQDEIVDPFDTSVVANASDAAEYGRLVTDLTGDGVVDSFDFSLVSNNADQVIYTQRP